MSWFDLFIFEKFSLPKRALFLSAHMQAKTSWYSKKLFVDINFLGKNEHSLGWAYLCSTSVVILLYNLERVQLLKKITICSLTSQSHICKDYLKYTYVILSNNITLPNLVFWDCVTGITHCNLLTHVECVCTSYARKRSVKI